jgi:hypothetical protein
MTRRRVLFLAAALRLTGQPLPKTYHLKLATPVNSKSSKPGAKIRAAVISPESLLNAYLEGTVEKAATRPTGSFVLRFDKLVYQGQTTAVNTVVYEWVNSKGHQSVDDAGRPTTLEKGEFRVASGPVLWLAEGAELRARTEVR